MEQPIRNPIKTKQPKCCDVPYCEVVETPTIAFDDTNVTCWTCKHFTCSKCCDKIWKGEWNGEQFYKPTFVLPFMKHELWMCPFCRASFDRMRETEECDYDDGRKGKWVRKVQADGVVSISFEEEATNIIEHNDPPEN